MTLPASATPGTSQQGSTGATSPAQGGTVGSNPTSSVGSEEPGQVGGTVSASAGGSVPNSAPPASSPSAGASTSSGTTQPDADDQILSAYDAFLTDLSQLDDTFSPSWVSALRQVATPLLVRDAEGAASAIQRAHEHGVGTLVDSKQSVSLAGSIASLTDCLNEQSWYVVEDATGQPDPEVSRGFFDGAAKIVDSHGHWLVNAWTSEPKRCTA